MEKQGFRFIILRVLAHRLQNLADFVSRQVVEEERPVLWEQANPESAGTGSVIDASRVVSSPESELAGTDDENLPAHWPTQAGTAEPPADWLARVQKAAPELLKQKRYTSRNVESQSHNLPAAQVDGNAHLTGAGAAQGTVMAETMQAETASSDLAAQGKPEPEEDERQAHKTDVPASPDSVVKKHDVERIGQESEPAQNNRPDITSTLAPAGEWLSEPVKQGSSPWEERPGTSANQQAGSYLWSQAGISQPSYGQRWPRLSQAGEHKQVEMRWPSLPDDASTDSQDWEMAQRTWERQQRLDEEQRGKPWNA